ncbi:uncharacterized protein PHALS_10828 [Plasmopara halstedii]|uniref:Uncharacterized protein n=1 Tax=Plasmopara halstedii TaxID=4781 RepID=A0A0P1AHM4_PLAHL|nr:uncharacterized protein PHALS_10828 [Plasmopara halstedii]CEG40642.1 hypothetical protein PHALS_10828 [Plasmopara halstedii]|eukprot:XP_024577011.1 hypothetical protein PHALS_10828 [Plasmopara halstedii]
MQSQSVVNKLKIGSVNVDLGALITPYFTVLKSAYFTALQHDLSICQAIPNATKDSGVK